MSLTLTKEVTPTSRKSLTEDQALPMRLCSMRTKIYGIHLSHLENVKSVADQGWDRLRPEIGRTVVPNTWNTHSTEKQKHGLSVSKIDLSLPAGDY